MKKTIFKTTMLCLVAGLTFSSCKKETGPKGDTGAIGPQGPAGNANVKTTIVSNQTWVYSAPAYIATMSAPNITQEIVDKGAVLVYLENAGTYIQLPITLYNNGYQTLVDFEHYLGTVRVSWADSDLTQPVAPTSNIKFKIVTIASSGMIKNVNTADYNEVKTALKLQD